MNKATGPQLLATCPHSAPRVLPLRNAHQRCPSVTGSGLAGEHCSFGLT